MVITLPKQLQKEAEALAQREGIDLETLVVQAVEHFLREQQYPTPRAAEAHRRLLEYDKYKKEPVDDFIATVREAKANAYRLYKDNEEWFDLIARVGSEHGSGWIGDSDQE